MGLCPPPLSAWGPGLASSRPDTQMPIRVGVRAWGRGDRVSPGDHVSHDAENPRHSSVPAKNPPVRGGGPGRPGGLGARRGQPVAPPRLSLRPSPDLALVTRVHGRAGRAVEVLRELPGVGDGADDPEAGGAVGVRDEALMCALGRADGAPDLGGGKGRGGRVTAGPEAADCPVSNSRARSPRLVLGAWVRKAGQGAQRGRADGVSPSQHPRLLP